jgi:hypothetical protein
MTDTRQHTSIDHVTAAGVVESSQRMALGRPVVAFDDAGARQLGGWYWACVRRATRGLVRPRKHAGGVSLTLVGAIPLLRFGALEARVTADSVACAFPITGGVLTLASGGWLIVEQRAGTKPSLSIAVTGYHARLARRRGRLYRHVQAPAHLAASRLFLQLPGRLVEQ